MNTHVKALLEAERAVAATADDDAFADRVMGRLRDAAIVGVAAGLATSSPAAAASASTVSATARTTAASMGVAKLVGLVGVVVGVVSVSLVTRTPSTTPAPHTQAAVNVPVERAAPVERVEPVDVAAVVDDATSAESSVVPASPRSRVVTTSMPARAEPAPPAPSSPTELERYDAASAMLRAGRVDEAAVLFAALLSTSPQGLLRPETHMSLLESLYRAGRFNAVVDAVPAALLDVDGARVAEVRRLEGDALVKLGRCDQAHAAYTAAASAPSRLTVDDISAALRACSPR
jgi:TolA-binding protein